MSDQIITAVWDIETDGLRDVLTRVHCLVIRDVERGVNHIFRKNDHEDTIEEGVRLLESAEVMVAHNGLYFDVPVLEDLYDFDPIGKHRDTLVLSRMIKADEKERDYRRFARDKRRKIPFEEKFPGKLIGTHGLESWGHRLKLWKGDYAKKREAEAKNLGILDPDEITQYVWGSWNQEMEDYCVQDCIVTEALWEHLEVDEWDPESILIEHRTHDLMGRQCDFGVPFDVEKAEKLYDSLADDHKVLSEQAIDHFGLWFKPSKKYVIDRKNKPRAEFGEDDSRKWWGEVVVPKKKIKYKDPMKGDRDPDCPFCPIKPMTFNPNSRPQIIDRFTTIYDWEPNEDEYTEKGNPKVSDEILRNLSLSQTIPIAEDLADIFYLKKRMSQIKDGENGWLKMVTDEGLIHHYMNVGGTISGRGSHSKPNLGQVPRVSGLKKGKNEDGSWDGTWRFKGEVVEDIYNPSKYLIVYSDTDPDEIEAVLIRGKDGDHGVDCRELFGTSALTTNVVANPSDWTLVGSDLSGIELRVLAERMWEFDIGEYADIILKSDIHEYNQNAAGLDTRDKAKTLIYALIYGGGDAKLGFIVNPLADEHERRALGAELRRRLLSEIPALNKLIKKIKKLAKRRGYLYGLDGRKLFVRKDHAALNTQLQSDGALISKVWCLIIEDRLEEEGLVMGWDGDFVPLLWVHDEVQIACRKEHAALIKRICVEAAAEVGEYFELNIPIAAESKSGPNWAWTH